MSAIYGEGLFEDREGMGSFASLDNANNVTQMGESEMDCFKKVSFLLETLTVGDTPPSEVVLRKHVEAIGRGTFTSDCWASYIAMRCALQKRMAQLLTELQFNANLLLPRCG